LPLKEAIKTKIYFFFLAFFLTTLAFLAGFFALAFFLAAIFSPLTFYFKKLILDLPKNRHNSNKLF
jgi:hypothetical protein